jgi:hypothetical protein
LLAHSAAGKIKGCSCGHKIASWLTRAMIYFVTAKCLLAEIQEITALINWLRQLQIRRIHIFWALAVFLLVWRIPYYGKIFYDDPYITFRYAANLAQHHQLVFNLGQYVLATTTPVYALLLSGAGVLGLPIPTMATLLNLVFEIAFLYVLGRIVFEFALPSGLGNAAYGLAALLIITNQPISMASESGMETPLFVLFNMLTLYYVMRRQYVGGAITGSLATLTRPDGIFALIVLGIGVLINERRLPIREVLISVLIGLPWVIVAYLTYGNFIPHSVIAKEAISLIWPMTLGKKLSILLYDPLRAFVILTLPPLAWAAWKLTRPAYRRQGWLILAFTGLHIAYMLLPDNLGFNWYFAPLYTLLDLLTGLGVAFMLVGERRSWLRVNLARLCGVGLVLAVAYTSVGNYLLVNTQDNIWRGVFPAIEYLKKNAGPGITVQSDSIGLLGYYTDYRVLDTMGLASPEVLPIIHDAPDMEQVLIRVAAHFRPDYIVTTIPAAYPGYDKVAEYPTVYVPFLVYKRSGQ